LLEFSLSEYLTDANLSRLKWIPANPTEWKKIANVRQFLIFAKMFDLPNPPE